MIHRPDTIQDLSRPNSPHYWLLGVLWIFVCIVAGALAGALAAVLLSGLGVM